MCGGHSELIQSRCPPLCFNPCVRTSIALTASTGRDRRTKNEIVFNGNRYRPAYAAKLVMHAGSETNSLIVGDGLALNFGGVIHALNASHQSSSMSRPTSGKCW